ncbi:hypothetical protein BDF14DRAFT_1887415 [Spinellus fusiger]|nr:hypothetical protein BDF14DRAFT_1887415 [Spinellus fusiger]
MTLENSVAQRAQAFSFLQVVFGLGGIVGAFIGEIPHVFGGGGLLTEWLTEYPYFLPCFLASAIASIGWIAGFILLEETLVTVKHNPTNTLSNGLFSNSKTNAKYNTFTSNPPHSLSVDTWKNGTFVSSFFASLTKPVIAICITSSLVTYQNVFYDELFSIWTASQRGLGGLGFSSSNIGTALSFSACITMTVQLFLFHCLTRRFGSLRLYRSVLFISVFVFVAQELTYYLYEIPDIYGKTHTNFWVWVGLLSGLAAKTVCQTIAITGAVLLLNNAVTRTDSLGAINGFSQCCASGMRAFGPATCGILWSTNRLQQVPSSTLRERYPSSTIEAEESS